MSLPAFSTTVFPNAPESSRTLHAKRLQTPRRGRTARRPSTPRAVLYSGTGSLPSVLILPGLGNSDEDYAALASALVTVGHRAVSVAPVARWDWFRNARGLVLPAYWRGTLTPDPTLLWYFERVDEALSELGNAKSAIIGHSAGGWLARAYLSARPASEKCISALVTLGTPHAPPPAGSFDQTRGLLTYVANECTLAGSVRAVCVAGAGVRGKRPGNGSVAESVAFYSYRALCGAGEVDGDGVIPLEAAFFPGAERVIVPACGHSMVGGRAWYGSPGPMDAWRQFLE